MFFGKSHSEKLYQMSIISSFLGFFGKLSRWGVKTRHWGSKTQNGLTIDTLCKVNKI